VFTMACHWNLSRANSIRSTAKFSNFVRSVIYYLPSSPSKPFSRNFPLPLRCLDPNVLCISHAPPILSLKLTEVTKRTNARCMCGPATAAIRMPCLNNYVIRRIGFRFTDEPAIKSLESYLLLSCCDDRKSTAGAITNALPQAYYCLHLAHVLSSQDETAMPLNKRIILKPS